MAAVSRTMNRISAIVESVRTSMWFVPMLMVALTIGGSVLLLHIDANMSVKAARRLGWIYTGGPQGARQTLSTIASSMITVAGVVFSITIVALSLASQQFGPRILRSFLMDAGNQMVLGTFISTFLYCILVLRTVRGTDNSQFVPHLSVTVAIGLSAISLAVLIYFIHHVVGSIRVENVLASLGTELHESIDRLFPEQLGFEASAGASGETTAREGKRELVRSSREGYVVLVHDRTILETAREVNGVLFLTQRPGRFVHRNSVLVEAAMARPLTKSESLRISNAFVIHSARTPQQDIEFAIEQIVEIAVRALSPAVNDPFSALSCVDRLGGAMSELACRRFPSPQRTDEDGQLRVVAWRPEFSDLIRTAFEPIRRAAQGDPSVLGRIRDVLSETLRSTSDGERHMAIRKYLGA